MRTIILTIAIFCLAIPAMTQEIGIGVNGGVQGLLLDMKTGSNKVGLGGSIGADYTYYFNDRWGISSGLSLSLNRNKATLVDKMNSENLVDDTGSAFIYKVSTRGYRDNMRFNSIDIPLLLRFNFGNSRNLYFNVGGKVMLPISQKSAVKANEIQVLGYYPDTNVEVDDLPQHGFGRLAPLDASASHKPPTLFAASAATGYRFKLSNTLRLYTGVYVDYGLNSALKGEKAEVPLKYTGLPLSKPQVHSILSHSNTTGARAIAYGFQLRLGWMKGDKKPEVIESKTNNLLIDTDGDGVLDKDDQCPDTPKGVTVDNKGCPIDTDGDGLADYLDNCPTEPGPISLKGCPDSDGDGVPDKDDQCPDTPKGWKVDAKGCPIDTDGDGIPDAEDECPTVAGTKANKGCPEKKITDEQINLVEIKTSPIHFVTDKSYLTDYSKNILDKMIEMLKANPSYNINVYGHADGRGSDGYNLKLSQDRIDATIKYLESNGISSSRIIHQEAFGKRKPIASNKTIEGRKKNRRVEFQVFVMNKP